MGDDQSWFGHLATWIDCDIFATGAGGYSTLQELILLKEGREIIQPDIVILQFY